MANIRSAYANLVADYLNNTGSASAKSIDVPAQQKEANWVISHDLETMKDGSVSKITVPDYATTMTSWLVGITTSGDITVSGH